MSVYGGPAPSARMAMFRRLACSLLAAALIALAATAQAAVGLTEIPGKEGDGAVTVYYPSSSNAQTVKRGPFSFQLAPDGAPRRGNGRLVMISHGSGGSPWVHGNLARALVEDGFIVAMPTHRGDNYQDSSTPGPESWRRRPVEISHAIDVVGQDRAFDRCSPWTRWGCTECRRVGTPRSASRAAAGLRRASGSIASLTSAKTSSPVSA